MATTARLDLAIWRNDEVYEFVLKVRGPDLTGVAMRAQIRLAGDTPGSPLVDLATTNANAEGIRLAGVTTVGGVVTNDVRIRLNKSTRQALPYAGETGEAARLAWGFLIDGRTRIEGAVYLPAQTYGSDAAPTDRPTSPGYGTGMLPPAGATLTISQDGGAMLSIDGADLIAPLVVQAQQAVTDAEAIVEPLTDLAEAIQIDAGGTRFVTTVEDAYGWVIASETLPVIGATETVAPNDARLTYTGFTRTIERSATRASFARPYNSVGSGGVSDVQQYFVPSLALSFVTDGSGVEVDIVFRGTVESHVAASAGGPFVASLLVDGIERATVTSTSTAAGDDAKTIAVTGLPAGSKTVEVIAPYLRPLAFGAVRVTGGTVAFPPARALPPPLVTAGDSITASQNAARTIKGYAFRLARGLGMRWVDTGYPSRQAYSADGARDGALNPRIGTYMIGANDFLIGQGQSRTLTQTGDQVAGYMTGWFGANADATAHLYVISPTPATSSPLLTPNATGSPWTIAQYRTEIAGRVAAFQSANPTLAARVHYVDGSTLMASADLSDGVHPTDTGHASISAALVATIQPVLGA